MRTIIRFDVKGKDRAALDDAALDVYREVTGDADAALPFSSTIEISPDTTVESGAGEVVSRIWVGEVTVNLPTEDHK